MANKTVSFTTAGNHWRWVGNYWEEVQVGQLLTMPERGKITAVKFKVAGLGPYSDPTYHDQQDTTKVAGAVWAAGNGDIITKSTTQTLAPEAGGSQTWKTFPLTNVWVDAGAPLIVGFWRISTSTQYATQWDYNDAAGASQEMVVHNIAGQVPSGPLTFAISEHRPGQSINYELDYITGGHVKTWHSTAWIESTPRVWDGANWVDGVVKRYNGSAWVEST